MPEVPLVFQGHIQQGKEVPRSLVSNLQICYPLAEGSALVTFDDPKGELSGGSLGREAGRLSRSDPAPPTQWPSRFYNKRNIRSTWRSAG